MRVASSAAVIDNCNKRLLSPCALDNIARICDMTVDLIVNDHVTPAQAYTYPLPTSNVSVLGTRLAGHASVIKLTSRNVLR